MVKGGEKTSGRNEYGGGVKHSVPLQDFMFTGIPRNGIPSIDNPKFISKQEGDKFLNDEDMVIGIVINGTPRANSLA